MKLHHRIIAALVLMAYAVTGTALVPAVTAALAALDGSHDVLVRESEQGTQLVLHHRQGDYTPEKADHRKCMARVLVSFCRQNQEGDHSLSSAHVTSMALTERIDATQIVKQPMTFNARATIALLLSLERSAREVIRVPVITKEFRIPRQPPPLSTTQLLI